MSWNNLFIKYKNSLKQDLRKIHKTNIFPTKTQSYKITAFSKTPKFVLNRNQHLRSLKILK